MSFFKDFRPTRLRRTRMNAWCRNLVREHTLSVHDLIWPVFVRDDEVAPEIPSMPDVERYNLSALCYAVEEGLNLGIQAVSLFPVIGRPHKNAQASAAFDEEGVLIKGIRLLKERFPEVGIITDVALDPYTDHGQDGFIANGKIQNDETVEAMTRFALMQARAGADIIAPSDMMDGRVEAIRDTLDAQGYSDVCIAAYAAKFASAFYGPYRDAVQSRNLLGMADKKTYQMDPANGREALREVEQDILEGADFLIVKPGMPYLDIVSKVHETFEVPIISYHVSGEYAMLKLAAQNGLLNYQDALLESMMCFKRAGCRGVITYAAKDVARLLQNGELDKKLEEAA